jgi:peptide deformylase
MQKTELVLWPSANLLKKADLITDFNSTELNKFIIQMYSIMQKMDGAGLSGPQIGLNIQILTYCDYDNNKSEAYMINPLILDSQGEVIEWEGCLSFPGVTIKVKRPRQIKIKYFDTEGKEYINEFKDFTARIIQHEIEHLQGKVFTQYLSKIKRDLVNRKMKKVKNRVQRT